MIFGGISPDTGMDTLCSALQAIIARRDTLHLPKTWSYVDLRPDAGDSDWLRSWASHLQRGTIGEVQRRDQTRGDAGISVAGNLYDWQVALGALLLFAGADRIRQDANGEIWPIVRGMLNPRAATLLFTNNNATGQLREFIKNGAIELCLRHDFDSDRIGQDWYNTFWLQVGFSYRGFYGDAIMKGEDSNLPVWLSGHLTGRQTSGTVAINLLLHDQSLHSSAFFQLWRAMAQFRRGERDDQSLRAVFTDNAWVLPDWHDDLVKCLETKRSIMAVVPQLPLPFDTLDTDPIATPCLRWQGNKPEFVFDFAPCCSLPSQDGLLTLHLKPQRLPASCRTLTRQKGENYALADPTPWIVPAQCQSVDAIVTDSNGVKVWQQNYLLWDGNEDVNIFALNTGRRLENTDTALMQATTEYVLFVDDDLGVFYEGSQGGVTQANLRRQGLTDTHAGAYLLPKGWSDTLQVRTCDDNLLIWQPNISSRANQQTLPATISLVSDEQRFDEPISLRVECHSGVTVEAASCSRQQLQRKIVQTGVCLLNGAMLSSTNPRLRLPLRLTFHTQGKPQTREIAVRLNPAGMLMRKQYSTEETSSWNVLPNNDLDVYTALHNQFRVFAPQRNTIDGYKGGWTLWEGETPHGEVMRDWRSLPTFDGLGAPFTAYTGAESQECLLLSASVVDHGVIESYRISAHDDGKRYLTIRLHQVLSSTQRLEIRWWDKWWQMQILRPSLPPLDREWTVPLLPSCHGEPFALAIALNGERLGAFWNAQWYNQNVLLQSSSLTDTARNLRWLRLPVLFPRAEQRIQQYIAQAGSLLEDCWLTEQGSQEWDSSQWKFSQQQTGSWQRAAETLLSR